MGERNRSVDIFRYVCAIMVVAIHTDPFSEYSRGLSFFVSDVVTRIAVPFFFATSGYFYINSLSKNKKVFVPYCKRLLRVYVAWSVVYFLIDFVKWGHNETRGYILHCIKSFFVYGSFYHFWFFPALIFAVCVTTALYKMKSHRLLLPVSAVLYIIGCLGCSYNAIGVQIPVLSSLYMSSKFDLVRHVLCTAVPFFYAGAIVARLNNSRIIKGLRPKSLFFALLGTILFWLAEVFVVMTFGLQITFVITFGLYPLVVMVMLVLLRFPMHKLSSVSQSCRDLADFTYYSHPMFVTIINVVAIKLLDVREVSPTLMFGLTVALTFVFGKYVYTPLFRKKARREHSVC